ncbi:MAG: hypothetical protein FD138_194 [Planctomycetota bacterium]|nr:MAG: hypothetical protein FD138_194 [Planctomycetota bacterium]
MKNLLRRAIGLILAAMVGVALSDEKADEADRAAQLSRMKNVAEKFEVESALGAKPVVAKLKSNPLLKYNDSTRRNHESTLWLWTERELPCALMAVEFYPNSPRGPRWLFEIVSLSNSKIDVARGGDWKWQAKQPGVIRKPVPGDLTPAEKPSLRLSQARQIRQRFAAHEKEGTEGRLELRALSTPLYRYADEETGVIDGAVFAFANGTNPEVLLLLEAQRDAATKTAIWTYGFAQMTGAAVYASLDDREVWSQKEADPPAVRDSYVNDWLKDDETEPRK